MKKLNTTPITNSAQYRVKKGSFDFLQLAYQEGFAAMVQALIGPSYDPAVVYILSGVVNSATPPIYNVSAGAVFYNGEIFLVDAASFTATGSNVAVFSIATTQYTTNADPVTLTDSTVVNIHDIRKMLVSQGASGSGIANLSQGFYLSFVIPSQLNLTAPTTSPYADNVLQLIGAYPNLQLYVPTPATNTFPILAAGSLNVGNIGGTGNEDFTVTFGTPLATSNYTVIGSFVSNGTPSNDTTVLYTIRSKTTNDFIVHFREVTAVTQNIAWEWFAIKNS